ncbi:hypothetical protein GALL_281190 [mine drainage metagenome]|uniref:Protein containing DUF498 n=1 Tax=mine drainage metagenome TaxID=410659 RepID=A0A1J5RPF3_9ZZZZ
MDITPFIPADRQLIQAYGDGGFRISGIRHEGAVLVFPGQTLPLPVAALAELAPDHLAPVFAAEPKVELLLLGTGAQMRLPSPTLRRLCRDHAVVLEPMDSGAACRTYNVLLSEDRRVAALLLAE